MRISWRFQEIIEPGLVPDEILGAQRIGIGKAFHTGNPTANDPFKMRSGRGPSLCAHRMAGGTTDEMLLCVA